MRILHLADLHLGKLFHDVSLIEDQAHILQQITTIARDGGVDAVVVTGDVYDRSIPPVQATQLMDQFLSDLLLDLRLPVILTPGNHDSAERLAFASRLLSPAGLFIAPGLPGTVQPVVLDDRHGPVTFYPLPYVEPLLLRRSLDDPEIGDFNSAMASLLGSLPAPRGRSICLGHCFTAGGQTCESERPLTIGGSSLVESALFQRFHLTLLGHLHRPQKISRTIFYAGAPLRYSFSESDHAKRVCIHELAADGSFNSEQVELTPLRGVRSITGTLAEVLAEGERGGQDDYLWVELTDQGALFDYAARLRAVYPNLLSITRSAYREENLREGSIQIRSRSEVEIVNAFFRHVTGSDPTEQQTRVITSLLEEVAGRGEEPTCAP